MKFFKENQNMFRAAIYALALGYSMYSCSVGNAMACARVASVLNNVLVSPEVPNGSDQ